MVWVDPTSQSNPASPADTAPPLPPLSPGGGLPPMASYGAPGQTWNKETMELLVQIEIPEEFMKGRNKHLFVWFKQALMQLQFGNYTKKDQDKMISDLRYIIFLAQQEGNEQIVFEEQLMFISNLMISKGRSDKPDGMRERTMWIMQMIKNIFSQEEVRKPDENTSKFNIPFMGGNR